MFAIFSTIVFVVYYMFNNSISQASYFTMVMIALISIVGNPAVMVTKRDAVIRTCRFNGMVLASIIVFLYEVIMVHLAWFVLLIISMFLSIVFSGMYNGFYHLGLHSTIIFLYVLLTKDLDFRLVQQNCNRN